ncbi:MAG: hypothetical protein QW538_03095 [Thermoplasmatales archaeon]
MPKVTFFYLIITLILLAAGAGYLTGISVRRFAFDTKDHLVSVSRMIIEFFAVFKG